ncbi:sugar phosphate isomerase/epimerase family protein [Flavobacterium seoulense]|uniref:Endonuclease n=1 Tax=Flavobacterium seoulense TaxID=1492738 RepID=A0A066WVA4_9FLAO|nr:TIM barrel protein [Flavobacterium seoulense]KDN56528.1 endonuclease [Flavobacterium seoulense]
MKLTYFKRNIIVLFLAVLCSTFNNEAVAQSVKNQRYKVAVCDWMILKRQKLGSFELASQIKADGIELDMGGLGNRETFDSKLADPVEVKKFKDKSKEFNVGISSIAMSGFYGQSFAKRETVKLMIQDCVDAMKTMNVKVAYLPLGNQCDLRKNPELRPVIIERLQWAAKQVKKVGGVIAIETTLDAADEKKLLKDIGCKQIKISFNFSNAIENKKDISEELAILGKKHLAQIHASNTDGFWLEKDPAINMPKIKATLDKMNWKGWLIVERSRDTTDVYNVKRNYGANVAYLKKIFQN